MSKVKLAVAGTLSLFAFMVSWRRKTRSSLKDDTACGDAGPSSKPTSCTPPPRQDCEVFLSFRGEDTRKGFTDHLYKGLAEAGVKVFRDNEGLPVGEEIGPELIEAIKASKISILIISENYASSEWCLRELVQILKCKKTGQIVLPIFYKVTPSDIKNQTGKFGQAFQQLLRQKKYGFDDSQKWRKPLRDVASLKGLELEKFADGHEAESVKLVLKEVLKKLQKTNLVVDDNLIGVQDRVEKIKKIVDSKAFAKVGAILIHGMGGIGKTTLAKLIYNQFSSRYDCRSFLPDVRESYLKDKAMVELQKKLISDILGKSWPKDSTTDERSNTLKERCRNKKVLIVLDDVDRTNQLDALAVKGSWFGSGSLLIITSRDKDILKMWDNKLTYGLEQLDLERSFQLFCFHAFGRKGAHQSELEHIAREIVKRTGGLPLAIKVIGSQLFGDNDEKVWEDTLRRLEKTPEDDVMQILKISYDSLIPEQKQIFLDIACFGSQIEKKFAYYVWDACTFFPYSNVKRLISLSLIEKGDDDKLIMHDQLKDLGKKIVREESSKDLEKRSRLSSQEDVWKVLKEIQGPKEVEGLYIMPDDDDDDDDDESESYYSTSEHFKEESESRYLTSEHFKDLTKLRLLFLDRVSLNGDFDNLLPDLQWLRWKGLSSMGMEAMPNHFHPKKLVVLDLYRIPVTEHWGGWSQPEVVQNLKVVRLNFCDALKSTPDISAFKCLEILILMDCSALMEIHSSIGRVCKTLKTLTISNCGNLKELPKKVGEMERLKVMKLPDLSHFKNLKELYLSSCEMLSRVEGIGQLTSLEELRLSSLPCIETIGDLSHLNKLRKLYVCSCEMLSGVEGIGQLTSLEELELGSLPCIETIGDLSHLNKLRELKLYSCEMLSRVEGIGQLTSLKKLRFSHFSCIETIGDLSHLNKLRELHLFSCEMLSGVEGIGQLTSLEELIFYSLPCIETIGDLSHLNKLRELHLSYCEKLSGVEGIGQLTSLKKLSLDSLPCIETIGDLSHLNKLRELYLLSCEMLSGVEGIGQLTSLEELSLESLPCIETIGDLSHLNKLRELYLCSCEMLSGVEGIGQLTSLEELIFKSLPCIETIGDLSHLNKLRRLDLNSCEMLSGVEGIGQLTSLEELELESLPCIETIGDLSHLNKLRELKLYSCEMLSRVEGIGQLTSLEELRLGSLPCIETIGDLSHLNKLKELWLQKCKKLNVVEGTGQLTSLEKLEIHDCLLERIGDLSQLKKLELLKLHGCEMLSGVEGIGQLTSLKTLWLEQLPCIKMNGDLSQLKNLRELHLSDCEMLSKLMSYKI